MRARLLKPNSLFLQCVIASGTVLALCSCAANTPNIKADAVVGGEEGIVIAVLKSAVPGGKVSFHKGVGSPTATFDLWSRRELRVARVKAGEGVRLSTYTVEARVGKRRYYFDDPVATFNIAAGAINYIGDIELTVNGATAIVSVKDNEAETLADVRTHYPGLLERFPYQKAVPAQAAKLFPGASPEEVAQDVQERAMAEWKADLFEGPSGFSMGLDR